ncbi:hypothetical protein A2U01_0078743, partial [Trifolium medium]|nr:hypothetical protein [Trifolium medium]
MLNNTVPFENIDGRRYSRSGSQRRMRT